MLQNKPPYRPNYVVSHVVLFAYRIMLNIYTDKEQSYKNSIKKVIYNMEIYVIFAMQ